MSTVGPVHDIRDDSPSVHIAVALDRNVAWGCAVSVRSAIENSAAASSFVVHVVHDGLDDSLCGRLRDSWSDAGRDVRVNFVPLRLGNATELVRSRNLSRMSYARLLLGSVLPNEVKRCVYLDTDLLFERDIAELYRTDLAGYTAAAVPDGDRAWDEEQLQRLGVKGDHYFNAGMMLIDLERWRAEAVGDRALAYCRTARPVLVAPFRFAPFFWDQDAINSVLSGRIKPLPVNWNTWAVRLTAYEPVVVHLITGPKPWDADYEGIFGDRFYEYLDRTAFRGSRPPSLFGMARLLKRIGRRVPYPPTLIRLARETVTQPVSRAVPQRF